MAKTRLRSKSSIISVTVTYRCEDIIEAFRKKALVKLIHKCCSVYKIKLFLLKMCVCRRRKNECMYTNTDANTPQINKAQTAY